MSTINVAPSPSSTQEDSRHFTHIPPLVSTEVSKKRSISEVAPDINTSPHNDSINPSSVPAKKKPKLSDEEKEAKEKEKEDREKEKRREKELKEKEKEVKKAEKEERRRAKEEEKRKRDEERAKKEEERRKRDEEKAKKERTQLRLNNFFTKPAVSDDPTPHIPAFVPITATPKVEAPSHSDYERTFHPFFVKPNVDLAPVPFSKTNELKRKANETLDIALAVTDDRQRMSIDLKVPGLIDISRQEIIDLLGIPSHKRGRRGIRFPHSTKHILAQLDAPDHPGLTPLKLGVKHTSPTACYLQLLNSLPYKYLKFAEDVRPPYNGTYTREPLTTGLRHGRKPFEKSLPGVDYDYASEAEWVADDDGEDLISEDEDDKDSVGDSDDLDGFLDDEEDSGLNKRSRMGVLVATNSGMCWENEKGINEHSGLQDMRISILLDGVSGPIDPFTTTYWEKAIPTDTKSFNTPMDPPRRTFASNPRDMASSTRVSELIKKDIHKKIVPDEDMEAFKRAIEGSDMTKTGLIEVLKKTFPKIGKDAIRNTIDLLAERVGEKRDDKRWVLR
ncbi:chromatin assembly factor 1 subunit A-domain-containing protein [Geopyxis carbonaria]|nr:chromatin assembly factor 1 subunit A-domain-containing protein [Geopyxis carbonaria]